MTMNDFPRYSAPLDAAERREFTPFVQELAAASAAVIRSHYLDGTAVEIKGDDSPVTAADRGAELVMRELIERRYPDHGLLGEEWGTRHPDARYRWVLDPIDGTRAFGALVAPPLSLAVVVARAASRNAVFVDSRRSSPVHSSGLTSARSPR